MTESKSKVSTPPILIGHLPRAEAEARKAFSEIQNNTYEKKSLGKQQQVEEVFPCDCHYEPGQGGWLPGTELMSVQVKPTKRLTI